MNALDKCRHAPTDSAVERCAAEDADKARDAADQCDALERFADDGGSWIHSPSEQSPEPAEGKVTPS